MSYQYKDAVKWVEIPAIEMNRAKLFYETIFQFTMTDVPLNENFSLCLFPSAAGGVGAALCRNVSFYIPAENGPVVYLNANPDLQLVLDRVQTAGGEILVGKRHVSDQFGYMALIRDSEGNRVALQSDK